MNFFKVYCDQFEDVPFVGADARQGWTWLLLMNFCARQENGGTINNARSKPDAVWTRNGISPADLKDGGGLWEWHGDDLAVLGYDVAAEDKCRANRELAAKGGIASGKSRRKKRNEANASANASTDREKERKKDARVAAHSPGAASGDAAGKKTEEATEEEIGEAIASMRQMLTGKGEA